MEQPVTTERTESIDERAAKLHYSLEAAVQHFAGGLEAFVMLSGKEDRDDEVTPGEAASLLSRGVAGWLEATPPDEQDEEWVAWGEAAVEALHRLGYVLLRADGNTPDPEEQERTAGARG